MHVDHRNPKFEYTLNSKALQSSGVEKDLGVLISSDLKPARYITKVALKANSMVGLKRKHFPNMTLDMCKTLSHW